MPELAAWTDRWTRRGYSASTVSALAAAVTVREFGRGEILIEPGQTEQTLLILEGYLAVGVSGPQGHQFILTLGRRGQCLVPPIGQPPQISAVEIFAVSRGAVGLIPTRLGWDVAERDPRFALQMLNLSRKAIARLLSRLEELTFSSARERLAVVLLAYQPLLAPPTPILSRALLADLVGVSREMTGRLFRDLEQQQIVRRADRGIEIVDADALRAVARWDETGREHYLDLRGPDGDDPLLDQ
jgi:CRP-like cAMP-binding protein